MPSKPVYLLVRGFFSAEKMVKTANAMGLELRAFDQPEKLIQAAKEKEPALVIAECEELVRQTYQVLEYFRKDSQLSSVPCIGYLARGTQALKEEMRAAGCIQVYTKTEFAKQFENLLMRFAHGLPSRV